MAIKLSFSVKSPIKYLRYAFQSLYWSRLNSTSFNQPYHNNKALNSNRHGYQVISLSKNTHQVTTICMSISLWIYTQPHNFWPSYRTYITLKTNRHGNQVISRCKNTHKYLPYAWPFFMDLYLIAQHSTNYRTYKALNSKKHGYQVTSLYKNTHEVSTIYMSISLWI